MISAGCGGGHPYSYLPRVILIFICRFDASHANLERFVVRENARGEINGVPVHINRDSQYVKTFLHATASHTGTVSDELTRKNESMPLESLYRKGKTREKKAGKSLLYRTLLETGMPEKQVRAKPEHAYPGIPFTI